MPAAVDRLQFAPPPPPGMLRALGLALVAHLLLMLALGWGINWKRDPVMLSAEAELWSALPQEAAPKLVEPAPVPPPPVPVPPPPVPVQKAEPPAPDPALREAEIALERQKEQKAEEKRKLLAQEREKKREADRQKQLEAKRELEDRRKDDLAKAKAAEDRKKLDATRKQVAEEKRIEAQRQANLDRIKGLAGATGGPAAAGTAQRSSGPSANYAGRIAARIKSNIVFPDTVSGNPVAVVRIRVAPDGTIVGKTLLESSGIKSWDDAVLRAIDKTGILPRDTDGRVVPEFPISFRPND
jgi:colicin import membrane protein